MTVTLVDSSACTFVDADPVETKYVDILLEGWAKWARGERGPVPPTPAGIVLRIPFEREPRYELRISDDEFTLVDARVAQIADRLRQIVELEYRGFFRGRRHLLSQEEKWHRLGLKRIAYRQRLHAAQWTLYSNLLPDVDKWRQRSL